MPNILIFCMHQNKSTFFIFCLQAWLSELPLDPSCMQKDHRSGSLTKTSNFAPPHKLLDPDLGGMAIFANMTELSKFVQTVQNCAGSVAVLPINSRHSQKLALS